MAKEHDVRYVTTTFNSIRQRLLGVPRTLCNERQVLSESSQVKKLNCCKKMLNVLKSRMPLLIVFTDEKLFNLEIAHNHQKHRILAMNINTVHINKNLCSTVKTSHGMGSSDLRSSQKSHRFVSEG